MSDENEVLTGGDVISYPTADDTPMTTEEAARSLTDARNKAFAKFTNSSAESAEPATAENELPIEGNAAADEDQPTGETEVDAPAEEPSRDLPRSWTKDRAEHWAKLDPGTQDFLLEQDRKASAEVRRVQNEAAEQRKAIQAEREAAEKARQQYETKLSSTVKVLETALQADFGDIQTMQNVRDLQNNDPFRFQAWQVRQMELAAAKSEETAAGQRQAKEKQDKRDNYEAEQNKLLVDLVPEMADPKKAAELRERAIVMLTDDLGLKNDLLARWMTDDTGHEILSNAGIQKLIADGLKYRDIQKAKATVAAKLPPPVQRPGVRQPAGANVTAQIKSLENQLSSASGDKAARISAEIWALERKVRSA
jgi:hypothetical protein